ncbi:HDIG domain-containing protein [Zhouia spongiae]|uniref:HDIG domain-containing protein n=1 Tax=Zhouia spongiae TaxID=2202721 RepID=A0ABY3YLA5_9FLAO|nr:HDIG domain-containing metalloprotein [Zhouia spongiae]UNY98625.1 HDIG domain-containing protein [Zhouia spongiae]
MKQFLSKIYKNQSNIYKVSLFLLAITLIIYLFPKGGKFKYDFQKGKIWQYETLYAPFDFAVYKTDEEFNAEKDSLKSKHINFYRVDSKIQENVIEQYKSKFAIYFPDSLYSGAIKERLYEVGADILNQIYNKGIVQAEQDNVPGDVVNLVKGNEQTSVFFGDLIQLSQLQHKISSILGSKNASQYAGTFYNLFFDDIKPNVFYDESLTNKVLEEELKSIVGTRGHVEKGKRIIAKGEVIEGERYNMLYSLRKEYESQLWSESNYNWILFGYILLVSITFLMLVLFLYKYRPLVYLNNNKVTFIVFNVLLMIFLTTVALKYNAAFIYVVPMCILPLILKAFFDPRLGLFAHVITVLLLGFIVPNAFEYVFLQIIAGIITIQTITNLHKRANLFISVAQITLIYILGYFGLYIIQEGHIKNIEWQTFGIFILNGLATLAAFPLIYIYEKLFGLVSDVSLLELTDTNSPLLKELAEKAPGTFHHSLQVANLAEAVANEIGANAMLVRVGALYHDVGKMNNPMYFTENQTTSVNPHDELSPKESAQVIIDHVIDGIEIAKKNKLPDRIIDFIRTHHGTSLVYYFYMKEKESAEDANPDDFRYPGPIPFSKETAILMMTDSVEAASKSLKNPTFSVIDGFVERIINKQIEEDQFINANITFKEIQVIKKVLKQKLTNIYHLRVEYPE